jgi:hypothetical protein
MPVGIDFAPFVGTGSFEGGRSVRYVSIGALGELSRGVAGVAVSGLASVEVGPVCGAQIAGLANVAAGFDGAQIGGIANVASEESAGLQTGLVNVANNRLRGAQIGLVGVARSTDLQLGLTSVAADAHVQIGLVNVANDADVQIGLVNYDAHGRLRLDAWAKPESGTSLVGLKHGPPHSHTLYAVELNVTSGRPWAVFGWGAHLTPSDRLYIDVDLLQHVELLANESSPNQLSELRVVAGLAIAPRLSIFAGPTYNVLVAPDLRRADAPGFASDLADKTSVAVRAWPGVALGVEAL